jgi:hypothetical protein
VGPAVNVVHRLLNSIQARLGYRPYLFLTDAAAASLLLAESGVAHREDYPDIGPISGRIVPLGAGPALEQLAGAADASDRLSGVSMGRSEGSVDPVVAAERSATLTSAARSKRRPAN